MCGAEGEVARRGARKRHWRHGANPGADEAPPAVGGSRFLAATRTHRRDTTGRD